jgi:hypothetical protein
LPRPQCHPAPEGAVLVIASSSGYCCTTVWYSDFSAESLFVQSVWHPGTCTTVLLIEPRGGLIENTATSIFAKACLPSHCLGIELFVVRGNIFSITLSSYGHGAVHIENISCDAGSIVMYA